MSDVPFAGLTILGSEKLCDPSGWPDPDEPVIVPPEFIPEGEDEDGLGISAPPPGP